MSRDEYITALADLLSGDPLRVAGANRRLFPLLVDGEDAQANPSLALIDAEQRLVVST